MYIYSFCIQYRTNLHSDEGVGREGCWMGPSLTWNLKQAGSEHLVARLSFFLNQIHGLWGPEWAAEFEGHHYTFLKRKNRSNHSKIDDEIQRAHAHGQREAENPDQANPSDEIRHLFGQVRISKQRSLEGRI